MSIYPSTSHTTSNPFFTFYRQYPGRINPGRIKYALLQYHNNKLGLSLSIISKNPFLWLIPGLNLSLKIPNSSRIFG